jgi:hypothetical protein
VVTLPVLLGVAETRGVAEPRGEGVPEALSVGERVAVAVSVAVAAEVAVPRREALPPGAPGVAVASGALGVTLADSPGVALPPPSPLPGVSVGLAVPEAPELALARRLGVTAVVTVAPPPGEAVTPALPLPTAEAVRVAVAQCVEEALVAGLGVALLLEVLHCVALGEAVASRPVADTQCEGRGEGEALREGAGLREKEGEGLALRVCSPGDRLAETLCDSVTVTLGQEEVECVGARALGEPVAEALSSADCVPGALVKEAWEEAVPPALPLGAALLLPAAVAVWQALLLPPGPALGVPGAVADTAPVALAAALSVALPGGEAVEAVLAVGEAVEDTLPRALAVAPLSQGVGVGEAQGVGVELGAAEAVGAALPVALPVTEGEVEAVGLRVPAARPVPPSTPGEALGEREVVTVEEGDTAPVALPPPLVEEAQTVGVKVGDTLGVTVTLSEGVEEGVSARDWEAVEEGEGAALPVPPPPSPPAVLVGLGVVGALAEAEALGQEVALTAMEGL